MSIDPIEEQKAAEAIQLAVKGLNAALSVAEGCQLQIELEVTADYVTAMGLPRRKLTRVTALVMKVLYSNPWGPDHVTFSYTSSRHPEN